MNGEFSQFFEACRDALLLVTPSGQIIQANAAAQALFGYGPGRLHGHSARRLFPGQPLGLRPPRPGPQPQPGAVRCAELVAQRADASQFPAEVQVIDLTTGQGPAAVLTIRDITSQQRAQLLDLAHGLLVRITDNGIGYSPADVEDRAGHLGLILMRERVHTAGGWCRTESAPGAGTTVEFWVPLTPPQRRRKTGDGRAA